MQISITLAGANFRPAEAKDFIKFSLKTDDKCGLERDAANQYDERAIRIIGNDNGEPVFIGFVPKSDNLLLSQAMDAAGADFAYKCVCTGFVGTLQPTFDITFETAPYDTDNYGEGGSEYGSEVGD